MRTRIELNGEGQRQAGSAAGRLPLDRIVGRFALEMLGRSGAAHCVSYWYLAAVMNWLNDSHQTITVL